MIDHMSTESKDAFERAFQACETREALMQLRLGLEEEAILTRSKYDEARRAGRLTGHYLAVKDFTVMERNLKLLGVRMQRVQNKLGVLNASAKDQARRERNPLGNGGIPQSESYHRRFHTIAQALLDPVVYKQIADAARDGGG